ncbi:hypothetical protein ACSX1C_10290 [Pseudomonas sp. MBLB4123]|uniref:hypothetical protein n=1 Tax=Pseudomonas sp. MBLB4123 TaxID=3451557 RepID=UPI003F756557
MPYTRPYATDAAEQSGLRLLDKAQESVSKASEAQPPEAQARHASAEPESDT